MKYFILTIYLFLSLTGCDLIYGLLDKEGAEEKKLIGEVIPFEKNVTIEEAQALLDLYGYNPGKADGVLGLRTRNSIERFQEDSGLKTSRFIDAATWQYLTRFKEIGFVKDNKLNIELVQSALIGAGFNPGKIDGKLGPKTQEAVKAFQKSHDLVADGKVGYKTLTKLSEYIQ